MTTATAPTTWPAAAELERVSKLIVEAQNALDELHLSCYRFNADLEGNVVAPPTFEELGRVSHFIPRSVSPYRSSSRRSASFPRDPPL